MHSCVRTQTKQLFCKPHCFHKARPRCAFAEGVCSRLYHLLPAPPACQMVVALQTTARLPLSSHSSSKQGAVLPAGLCVPVCQTRWLELSRTVREQGGQARQHGVTE